MGFAISWLAFKGMSADEACAAFEAVRTGETAPDLGPDLLGLELPGWYLVFVEDRGDYAGVTFGFAEHEALPIEVLTYDMVDSAGSYRLESHIAGTLQWSIWSDSNQGPELLIEGKLPLSPDEIRSRLEERQKRQYPTLDLNAPDQELPAELGLILTGFHHELYDESIVMEVLKLPRIDARNAARAAAAAAGEQDWPELPRSGYRTMSAQRPWWRFW